MTSEVSSAPDYNTLINSLHVDVPCPQLFMYFASGASGSCRYIQRLNKTERKHWSEENANCVQELAREPGKSIAACVQALEDSNSELRIKAASALYALAHYPWAVKQPDAICTCLQALENRIPRETERFVRHTLLAYLAITEET